MKNPLLPFRTLIDHIITPKEWVSLSIQGTYVEISAEHHAQKPHTIEEIEIYINGIVVADVEYSTRITESTEIVMVKLPERLNDGDEIIVDTQMHRLGSRKIHYSVASQ